MGRTPRDALFDLATASTETLLSELERLVDAWAGGQDPQLVAPAAREVIGQIRVGHERLYTRLDEILRVVTAMTALDFRHKLEPREDDDWVINALAIGLNITGDELRRRAEALTETRDRALAANRAKTSFLTNMSHELRTPLNAIIGYSELLREECADVLPEHQLADLDRVVGAGRHLLALIKETLDLSKIEAGKVELIVESFAVDPLIDEVVGTVRTLADSRGNELIVERGPGLGRMVSDRTRLAQILYNLLSNAIKFTTLGTVRFAVCRAADAIVFAVEDTGIGIPQDKLDLVFGAFNQADEEITRRFGGTGLGLTIARHFTEMMGGEITVASELGSGSVFTLSLPDEVANVSGVYRRTGEPRRATARDVVLVVSDDPRLVEALNQIVGVSGAPVVPVATSHDVARLAMHLRPSVIVLDDRIPELGTVLLQLGADLELAVLPRFIVGELRDAGSDYPGSEALARPLRHDEVLAALRPHLRPPPRLGRLLIVGADERGLRATLMRRGWRVYEAASVEAIRQHITTGRPVDLVVLDLALPWAPEAADLLRRHQDGHPRAVIGVGDGAAAAACTAVVPRSDDPDWLLTTIALAAHALGPGEMNR
jgi:signal transduction histidine kinase/DNA-binding response OmpR family regulator